MWGAGTLLLVIGGWGDTAGVWSDQPFLTNVVSSATGAAYGVPLTLVVFQRITAAQAEAVEIRTAHRLAAAVSADLARSAAVLMGGQRDEVREAAEGMRRLLIEMEDVPRTQGGIEYLRRVRELNDRLIAAQERADKAVAPDDLQVRAEVSAHWTFLSGAVRIRILETGGTWLAPPLALRIDQLVRLLTATHFLDKHREEARRAMDWALEQHQYRAGSNRLALLKALWRQVEFLEGIVELIDLTEEAHDVLAMPAAGRT